MRKLVACLACRNNGTRLYGKPLQNLDIENGVSILDYMLKAIDGYAAVAETVLAISEGVENEVFIEIAKKHGLKYYVGSEVDVLDRLIKSAELAKGTDIFRLTSESPFTYFETISGAWESHVSNNIDLTTLDNLPDGSGFEIVTLDAYNRSWAEGESRHRSELCSLYIRENKSEFTISYVEIPAHLRRTDIRLTVDYPEDLAFCRKIYEANKQKAPFIPLTDILTFLDENPGLLDLVAPFVEEGLKTMYL